MIGYLYALFYIITIAVSLVWVDSLGDIYPIGYLLFATTLTATVFFNGCCLKSIRSTYAAINQEPILWLYLSITVLITWGFSYYTTVHASATIAVCLFFTSQALLSNIHQKKYTFSFLCLALIGLVCYAAKQGTWLSYLAGILSGFCSYLYFKASCIYSKKLNKKPIQVLAVRYYLLLVISLGLVIEDIITHQSIVVHHHSFSFSLITLILLGLSNMVIPNFFSQCSVQKIGPAAFAYISTLIPVITYLCQGVIQKEWDMLMLSTSILVFILLNLIQFFNQKPPAAK